MLKDLNVFQIYMASNGERYHVCKTNFGGHIRFGAVAFKDVDDNGRFTRKLLDADMYLSETLSRTIKRIENDIEINALVKQGTPMKIATIMVECEMSREKAEKIARW